MTNTSANILKALSMNKNALQRYVWSRRHTY